MKTTTMTTTFAVICVLISSVLIFGSLARAQKDVIDSRQRWSYEVMTQAPETARVRRNPLAADPDAVAAGGKLYELHCNECHGKKAGGTRWGPSLLRPEVQDAAPGAVFWVLTNGAVRHGMPVWSKLPEPERWQIVTFLQSLKSQPDRQLGAPTR